METCNKYPAEIFSTARVTLQECVCLAQNAKFLSVRIYSWRWTKWKRGLINLRMRYLQWLFLNDLTMRGDGSRCRVINGMALLQLSNHVLSKIQF